MPAFVNSAISTACPSMRPGSNEYRRSGILSAHYWMGCSSIASSFHLMSLLNSGLLRIDLTNDSRHRPGMMYTIFLRSYVSTHHSHKRLAGFMMNTVGDKNS